MSTGLNCQTVQTKPDEWFYILEDYSAPKMAWDWREYATAYGPFKTEEEADEHLRRHHANPGGGEIITLEHYRPEEVTTKLFEEARKAMARESSRYGGWR